MQWRRGGGVAGRCTSTISTSRPGLKAPYQSPDDEPVLGRRSAVRLGRHRDLPAALCDLVEKPVSRAKRGEGVTAQGLAQRLAAARRASVVSGPGFKSESSMST